ncbi:hypothetical protein BC940DRAFT_293175 [Gongronella butleri]|nr:hypothetical protein BC940DRAFT_293175 [Gongronella butleri]
MALSPVLTGARASDDDDSDDKVLPNVLSAPPPSPQDTCPLDDLFAQHLTTKLQQLPLGQEVVSPLAPAAVAPWLAFDVDTAMPSHAPPPPVAVPRALPLTSTTTYHHHSKKKPQAGVDPHQLELLLRNVSKSYKTHHPYQQHHSHQHHHPHHHHLHRRRRSWQLHPLRPTMRKKTLKPSHIPVLARRHRVSIPPHRAIDHTPALSTAVDQWNHQQQDTNNAQIYSMNQINPIAFHPPNSPPPHDLDHIVKDMHDLGLS